MTAGRIDRVSGARVRFAGTPITKTARYANMRVGLDGSLEEASSTGAHTAQFTLYNDGASYTVTYYNSAAANNYAVAYYDINGTLIGGIPGGGANPQTIKIEVVTPPTGTRMARVFCLNNPNSSTYNKEASMVPTVQDAVYDAVEMRVKPAGAAQSIVVWPTTTFWRIKTGTTPEVRYSRYDEIFADGSNYAYVVGSFEEVRGVTVVNTENNVRMTITHLTRVGNITINGQTLPQFTISNNAVYANDLKTTETGYLSCKVYASLHGISFDGWVNQGRNRVESTTYTNDSVTGYRIELGETDFTPSGGTTQVYGYSQRTHRPKYTWTSGSSSYGAYEDYEADQSPTSISASPSSGVTISGTSVTFPANTGTNEIVYTITGTWSGRSGTAEAYVYGSDTGRTYGTPSITSYYYPNSATIPASGGDMYPYVGVSIPCTVNGSTKTLTGHVSAGETTCDVSGGGISATVTIEYLDVANGYVSAQSRGTNEDYSDTIVASGLRVRVSKGSNRTTSSGLTVYQQQNQITNTQAGTFHVTAISVAAQVDGNTVTQIAAVETSVLVETRVTGSGTTTKYWYTSGATSGGNSVTLNNSAVTPTLTVKVGTTPITTNNGTFTANNQHNLTNRVYSITASYEDSGNQSLSLTQLKDNKIPGAGTPVATLVAQPNTNTISAAGGEVLLEARGYTDSGLVWESDGALVTGESSRTWNTDGLVLDITQSGTPYTITPVSTVKNANDEYRVYRVDHRNMQKNVTTDTISVAAKNGAAFSSPLSYSASNARSTTPRYGDWVAAGQKTYGAPVPGDYQVSLSAANYTSSSTAASFAQETYIGLLTMAASYVNTTPWTRPEARPVYYDYDSGAYDETQETRTGSGSDVSDRISTTPTLTASEDWLTPYTSGDVTFGANTPSGSNPGWARSASIEATCGNATASIELYQKKYIALSITGVEYDLMQFGPSDTVLPFKVVWYDTGWTITSTPASASVANPVSLISPSSGGRSGSSGETDINVTARENMTNNYFSGTITVTSTEDTGIKVTFNVIKQTAYQTLGYYAQITSASIFGGVVSFAWSIRNENQTAKTFTDVTARLLYADHYIENPGESNLTLVRTLSLSSITVQGGGATVTGSGDFGSPVPISSDRFYYVQLSSYYFKSPYFYVVED